MKTLAEKRFFEWHEDDKSVTLRNRGGLMAEGQRSSLSTVPRQSRSIVRHRLQVGAARTSNAREVDSMREVIGLDLYNQCTTGEVSMSIRATRGDTEHIPCVLIGENDESKSIWFRPRSNERCRGTVSSGSVKDFG